jgi:hypothetical protein
MFGANFKVCFLFSIYFQSISDNQGLFLIYWKFDNLVYGSGFNKWISNCLKWGEWTNERSNSIDFICYNLY